MRLLAQGVDGDPPLVAGESGCAATAGLIAAMLDPDAAADEIEHRQEREHAAQRHESPIGQRPVAERAPLVALRLDQHRGLLVGDRHRGVEVGHLLAADEAPEIGVRIQAQRAAGHGAVGHRLVRR